MQIVIDIDEEKYDVIKSDLYNTFPAEMKEWGLEAIRNGTPLPKGHGRLGDLDELEKRIDNYIKHHAHMMDEFIVLIENFILDGIKDTPTVVEADKEE